MRNKTDGTTTVKELAILASSCGLVEKSDEGRKAFEAWWANDPKAARKALFSRVAARRVAASAAKAQAPATQYPSGWRRPAGIGAPAAQATATPATKKYPGNWLRGSAIPGPRVNGTRVTEARD